MVVVVVVGGSDSGGEDRCVGDCDREMVMVKMMKYPKLSVALKQKALSSRLTFSAAAMETMT